MYLIQVNDLEGVLKELVSVHFDRREAEFAFIQSCMDNISNWDEYEPDDIAKVLDEGYALYGGGVVMFIDASNCITDTEIRDTLTKQPSGDMTIAEIIHDGELNGDNLDAACSWDIQGQVVFKGSDGVWYTITTESTIGECTNEFITDVLSEIENG